METATKIKIIADAEELKLRLRANRITSPHFRVNATEGQFTTLLRAAYAAEVELRGRKYLKVSVRLENIAQIAKFMTSDNSCKFGIMFCGECGNGKTTMLKALQNSISFIIGGAKCREYEGGMKIVDAKHINRIAADAQKFDAVRDQKLLAIEDLGREPSELQSYGNLLSPMVDLLEYRYDKQLFTAITTNLSPNEIAGHYGERIADRFREMVEVVVFKGGSFRAKN